MKARRIVIAALSFLFLTGSNLYAQEGNPKAATWLPALIWNPLHFSSGDSLYQTLIGAGYTSTQTDSIASYMDSLSNYHLFIIGGIYEHGGTPIFSDSLIRPFLPGIIDFLRNSGSLYWEGAVAIGDVYVHDPWGDSLGYYFPGGGSPGPPFYSLCGRDGTIFENIDSLGYNSGGAWLDWLDGDPDDITRVVGPGSDCASQAFIASVDQSHTMLANFSWSRLEDTDVNTRMDLADDVMAWLSGAVGIEESDNQALPDEFSMSQNYPNPFNAKTTIKFALPRDSRVKLEIYDILGKRVTTLIDGYMRAGYHDIVWDSQGSTSGIYFYRISTPNDERLGRMILVK
jgi:hypothetical protein